MKTTARYMLVLMSCLVCLFAENAAPQGRDSEKNRPEKAVQLETKQELYATIIPFMERPLIKLVLKKTGGNQVRTAELLGINRNTLRKKIKDLAINIVELT